MLKQALVAIIFLIALSMLVFLDDEPRTVRYDCSMAEFHPDYPKEVKEQCRKIRSNKTGFI